MKKKFILLMGSDGSGKSTIANELNNKLGYRIQHFGPVKNYEEGKNLYFNFINETNEDIICDRFHEGEAIYAPIYRNYDGSDYFKKLETELKYKFEPLLVLLQPPFQTILKRIDERGEDFVQKQHFEYCYDKITEIFNDSTLPKIVIDTSRHSVDENVEKILKKVEM